MSTSRPLTAFISGPLSPSPTYFTTYYLPVITSAITDNHYFVLGPAVGIDTIALNHLLAVGVPPSNITVYLAEFQASWRERYEALGCKTKIEGTTTSQRDAAMTRDSDYDILRYLTEEEAKAEYGEKWWPRVSNTEMNERRRKQMRGKEEEKVGLKEGMKRWLRLR